MKSKFIIGSVSSGTLLPEDTIPVFLHTLRQVRGTVPRDLWLAAQGCLHNSDRMEEHGLEVANDLIAELSEWAPPYFYFGAHLDDGADFGFWLGGGAFEDWDGLRVNDTSEVPSDYTGEVLHTNDHGNLTLYTARKGKLTEVWGIV